MSLMDCANCEKLGISCAGKSLSGKPMNEVIKIIVARTKYLGITHKSIAEKANMPQGTIDSLLSGHSLNPTWETLRPIMGVLGFGAGEEPCHNPDEIMALQAELAAASKSREEIAAGVRAEEQKKIEFLKAELKNRKRANVIISIVVGLLVLFAFWLLLVDSQIPEWGLIRIAMAAGGAAP